MKDPTFAEWLADSARWLGPDAPAKIKSLVLAHLTREQERLNNLVREVSLTAAVIAESHEEKAPHSARTLPARPARTLPDAILAFLRLENGCATCEIVEAVRRAFDDVTPQDVYSELYRLCKADRIQKRSVGGRKSFRYYLPGTAP